MTTVTTTIDEVRRKEPRKRPKLSRKVAPWLFVAPSLAILLVFVVWPIFQSLRFSLHDWKIGAEEQEWVGLDNYTRLLNDDLFWNALRVTLIFAFASLVIQLTLAYLAASALQRETFLNKAIRSVYFFPTIVALATIGIVWRFLLDPNIGLIGGITDALGFGRIGWLQSESLALPTVIGVSIWKNVGFSMMIILAGLKGIPQYLYEAASLDGAKGWQVTRHVTLPALRPTLLLAAVMLTVNSMQMFDLVYAMTNGGPLNSTDTLVTKLFREGFIYFDHGYASAIAWVLFLIVMILSIFQFRLFRYDDVDE